MLKFQSVEEVNNTERQTEYKITPILTKIRLKPVMDTNIPSNHWAVIKVNSYEYIGDEYIEGSIRLQEGREICVPNTIIKLSNKREAFLPVVNLSDQDLIVQQKKIIARVWPCIEEATPSHKVLHIKGDNLPPLNEDDITVGPVKKQEKEKLYELLMKYRDCIAETVHELGCAKTASMDIQLKDSTPFTYRPYRMAKSEQDKVAEIVAELLDCGVIRESESEYSSPVVLVKKKNGEARMCVDYRKLNSLTIQDNYPLPRIDDQIDRLREGVYFTSLDLKSGYYQIPLKESAKKYTAFATFSGLYEFNRMPFGLTNAPRYFQRFMNKVLGPVHDIAAVYLDDVLLHARTLPEAMYGLKRLLRILREQNLTLNLKKCSFFMTSIEFLGFEIERGTVKPGIGKTRAIDDFPVPKSVRNIRQFLGLTGYFRQFVKNYAQIAKPLTMLLRKNIVWKWTDKEDKSFQELKKILVNRPVLALFHPTNHTEVHTDASALGLGGILLQKQEDEKLHPVAYYSRQTSDLESKFHSYELETLAVVETLKKFRPYLIGVNFTVVTDCNSLKATKEKKQLLPRIARW